MTTRPSPKSPCPECGFEGWTHDEHAGYCETCANREREWLAAQSTPPSQLPTPTDATYALAVLRLFAKYNLTGLIDWEFQDDGSLMFYYNVNDVFWWACGDAEDVTSADLPDLERAIQDCIAVDDCSGSYGPLLWVCRKRQLRPQGAAYPTCQEVWPLLDAAGPEREIDGGNPKAHPRSQEPQP